MTSRRSKCKGYCRINAPAHLSQGLVQKDLVFFQLLALPFDRKGFLYAAKTRPMLM